MVQKIKEIHQCPKYELLSGRLRQGIFVPNFSCEGNPQEASAQILLVSWNRKSLFQRVCNPKKWSLKGVHQANQGKQGVHLCL